MLEGGGTQVVSHGSELLLEPPCELGTSPNRYDLPFLPSRLPPPPNFIPKGVPGACRPPRRGDDAAL